jgi:sigma-B regulation protein RsbU (phosphoserine phosphatase)
VTNQVERVGVETAIEPEVRQNYQAVRSILVVDDSPSLRLTLSRMLRRSGYLVREAGSGLAALEACREDPPDLVLSDWMMPEMDGLEFCREFRSMSRESYGYFILLTSKSDKEDIARGFDAGADDFLTKPVNGAELRARITAAERVLRMELELTEKNRLIRATLNELQAIYESINGDLIEARKLQQSLVSERHRDFGAAELSLLLRSSGHVGGDLVGMFSPGPARVGFYNIDVSGHGITSAMMTARLGGYLSSTYFDQNVGVEKRFNRFYALRQPEEVCRQLNNRLMADAGVEEYFTMAYGIIDLRTGLVRMTQAGHPHPLLIRRDGRCEFVGQGGVPIGLFADAEFEQFSLQLSPGDRLLLYSDGFTECPVKSGGMLEEEGLLRLVRGALGGGGEFLDDLYWRLTEEMAQGQGMDDDVSATLLEFNGY